VEEIRFSIMYSGLFVTFSSVNIPHFLAVLSSLTSHLWWSPKDIDGEANLSSKTVAE